MGHLEWRMVQTRWFNLGLVSAAQQRALAPLLATLEGVEELVERVSRELRHV